MSAVNGSHAPHVTWRIMRWNSEASSIHIHLLPGCNQSLTTMSQKWSGMTPLTRWNVTNRDDVTEVTGEQYGDKEAQRLFWQVQEENRQLHKTIEDMKHSSERDETDLSQCPVPLPRTHSLRKTAKKQTSISPVPAPHLNKSLIAQVSNQTSKETGKPVMDDKRAEPADEEPDDETELSSELSEMRLQSTPKNRHVQYQPRSPYTVLSRNEGRMQMQVNLFIRASHTRKSEQTQENINRQQESGNTGTSMDGGDPWRLVIGEWCP
ncbi:hypothetical protein DPX16_23116 [Anabarilius grahami]|uniref:Uncharacterized protein n=1 Tax=Anabarilius grahami TaxID=495550 RepID=A0A3N0XJF0_ANAGA|nr:hypothetical protein DPX16_23116 [Anabarilius grahami]